jgi:hypothetical protein
MKKCIPKEYREGELNKGEGVCIDRCAAKFFDVQMKISGFWWDVRGEIESEGCGKEDFYDVLRTFGCSKELRYRFESGCSRKGHESMQQGNDYSDDGYQARIERGCVL